MPSVAVNWTAVVVAAVIQMVLGTLWYGPLFGKQWMKLMGFTKAHMEKGKSMMPKTYSLAFVGSLVLAYVYAYFLGLLKVTDATMGAQVGFWIWLGFVVTTSFSNVLFEGRNKTVWYINLGYNLVLFAVVGALLASWR